MPTYNGTTGNDTINGGSGDDLIYGLAGSDSLIGQQGNDTIYGGGGSDSIGGWAGNDTLIHHGAGGILSGDQGDDYMEAKKVTYGQYHFYAGIGNDRLVMSMANNTGWGTEGHHAYGGDGADRFEFTDTSLAAYTLMSRIDDFDASRDSIWINGVQITNWSALPSGARVVEFWGQQFLLIGSTIVIGLEGARLEDENPNGHGHDGEESHFWHATDFPSQIFSQPTVTFVDQVNYVPYAIYSAVDGSLVRITGSGTVTGTASNEYIRTWASSVTNDMISAAGGNDVVDSGQGRDTVYGGEGNDLIAGGIDRDSLFGDNGNDQVWGGGQNDMVYGGGGNDNLRGGTSNDSVYGGTGDDTLNGDNGIDRLFGDDGRDNMTAGSGNDLAYGGAGNDTIWANDGNDLVWGDAGNDNLTGGTGADTLRGGANRDQVTGSSGNDVFVFQSGDMISWNNLTTAERENALSYDRITDFVIGQDKINFSGVAGATQISDFTVWKYTEGTNVFFYMDILATHERVLVDVADTVTWSQFTAASNFIFN
jgi:Ca2+-binding RTX toxin-like protein